VRLNRLDHLRIDAQNRVQGHHRILENHRDPAAAQGTHALLVGLRQVFPTEQDLAFDPKNERDDDPTPDDGPESTPASPTTFRLLLLTPKTG